MSDPEWITLREAAEMLNLDSFVELAEELNLSARAIYITDKDLSRMHVLDFIVLSDKGNVPVRQVSNCDYLYTSASVHGRAASSRFVHPISHVFRESVLPWAAKRAADLLKKDCAYQCPVHGTVERNDVVWAYLSGEHVALCGLRRINKNKCRERLTPTCNIP